MVSVPSYQAVVVSGGCFELHPCFNPLTVVENSDPHPSQGADRLKMVAREQVGADRYLCDSNTCGLLGHGECRKFQEYRGAGERRLPGEEMRSTLRAVSYSLSLPAALGWH